MKVQMTKRTKKLKTQKLIFTLISIVLELAVPVSYAIKGISSTTTAPASEKIVVGLFLGAAIIMVVLNIFLKIKLRSLIWVLLSIAYVSLNSIGTMILLMCITSLVNDCVIEPILKNIKEQYKINYEIDRRSA